MAKRLTNAPINLIALAACLLVAMALGIATLGQVPAKAFAASDLAAANLQSQDVNLEAQVADGTLVSSRMQDDHVVLGMSDAERRRDPVVLMANDLTGEAINWSSDEPAVVEVMEDSENKMTATLTPKSPGRTRILASDGNGNQDMIEVYVCAPDIVESYVVTTVMMKDPEGNEREETIREIANSIETGDSCSFTVVDQELPDGWFWEWSVLPIPEASPDFGVATITPSGVVTSEKAGMATLDLSLKYRDADGITQPSGVSATYVLPVVDPTVVDLDNLNKADEAQIRIEGLKPKGEGYEYTGNPIEPLSWSGVNLLINGAVVDVGETGELEVSYSGDHTSANQDVSITISAKPDARHFKNSITITDAFHISPLTFMSNRFLKIGEVTGDYYYTGSPVKPRPNVTLDEKVLEYGVDYEYAYSNNVDAGKNTASVWVVGKGNYEGVSSPETFSIMSVPLNEATIVLSATEVQYLGRAINPSVTVMYGGVAIPMHSETTNRPNYTVTITDNVEPGIATVSVAGYDMDGVTTSGNAESHNKTTFKIVKQSSSDAGNTGTDSNKNNNSSSGNSNNSSGNGSKSNDNAGSNSNGSTSGSGNASGTSGSNNSSSNGTGGNASNGSASGSANGSANSSNNKSTSYTSSTNASSSSSSKSSTSSATKLTTASTKTNIDKVTVSKIANKAFTGKEIKPLPYVHLNGKVLWYGEDYKLAYKNNAKVGTAIVTVTGIGKFKGTKTVKFKIVKAKNPMTAKAKAKVLNVKYSKVKNKAQTIKRSKALKISKAKGKLTYKKLKGSKKITVNKKTGKITVKKGIKKGTYKVKVKVRAAGNAGYKAKSKTVTLKIRVK